MGSREKWLYFSYTRGTAAGGIRIIKTMGSKIIALKPIHGFAVETSAAFTILSASHMGLPVSTTHVIPGAIMGVGASQRVSAVGRLAGRPPRATHAARRAAGAGLLHYVGLAGKDGNPHHC